MSPPTSKVWKFFKRCNDSKTVKCQLCEVELTYTGGTTNMLNPISVCLISFWMTILRTMLNLKLQPLCEKGLIQTLILLRGGKIIPINIQDSVLARRYLAVPSERIFSAAGLIATKLRNRLSSSCIDQIIFLSKNSVPQ